MRPKRRVIELINHDVNIYNFIKSGVKCDTLLYYQTEECYTCKPFFKGKYLECKFEVPFKTDCKHLADHFSAALVTSI